MKNLLYFSNLFLKLAQISFEDQELKWIPEHFKSLQVFKDFPTDKIEKAFSKYGLKDFREKVENLNIRNEAALDLIIKLKSTLIKIIYTEINSNEAINEIVRDINEIPNESFIQNGKIILPINIQQGNIRFQSGSSFFKIYNKIIGILNLEDKYYLESIKEFKDYSLVPTESEIVFSTKINDLVGISSRGIRSCQSLFESYDETTPVDLNDLNSRESPLLSLAGTVLSKYVGVIYLTSKTNFMDRGERMLFRSIVRIIYNPNTNKPLMILDQLYPKQNKKIEKLFLNAIKKHSTIPVISVNDANFEDFKFVSPEFDEEEIPKNYQSYRDAEFIPGLKTLLKLKNSTNPEDRIFAVKYLPEKFVIEMIKDVDPGVRFSVSNKIGKLHYKLFLDTNDFDVAMNVVHSLQKNKIVYIIKNNYDKLSIEFLKAIIDRAFGRWPDVIELIKKFDPKIQENFKL